jgi:hypothetical protein
MSMLVYLQFCGTCRIISFDLGVQVIAGSLPPPQPEEKLGECQLNRALVFDDSPDNSDESSESAVPSSVSLQEGSAGKTSSPEEGDSSSAWSTQVHASSEKGDQEELDVEELAADYTEEEEEFEEEDDWEEDSDDGCYDDLCDEMSRMTVLDEGEKKTGLPQFEGKHTRFIYNSDDEIEREEVADAAEARAELGALMLRGLPVPEGRHLRFHDDKDDEE